MSRCGYMHVSAVPAKARRGHKIPLELEFPAVVTGLTWVVETQLRSSGRAARYRSSPHTHEFKETGRGRRKKLFSCLIIVVQTWGSYPNPRRKEFRVPERLSRQTCFSSTVCHPCRSKHLSQGLWSSYMKALGLVLLFCS